MTAAAPAEAVRGAADRSVYSGRPRPAEAVLEHGEPQLSRRRETLEDLLARDL